MTKLKLIPTIALMGVLLTGCKSDGELKGIERFIPPETTTTSNPYIRPSGEGSYPAKPADEITRTTISYDREDCADQDVDDDEPDVYEEFCD